MIRLVIYDDDEQRRLSLKAVISMSDNMTCVADFSDCREVIRNMEEYYPDVVLMDISMPYVSGINAVSQIKNQFPEIRIIMQTVFEDPEKIFSALQAGAEGYLLKSASAEKITQSIEDVYRGGAYMTPSVALKVMQYFNAPSPKKEAEYSLTSKELEVLQLLSQGQGYKMVADSLGISYYTVNDHIKRIYYKLHVHSIGEAVALAYQKKIVS
jgi:DNA-binding NarL/FixJ family response regulator